jgi:lipoprotein-anchoring transpeptidase ErfK/SrfK
LADITKALPSLSFPHSKEEAMVRALAGCAMALALAAACPDAARGSQAAVGMPAVIAMAVGESVDAAAAASERALPGTGEQRRPPAVTLTLEADLRAQRLTVREGDRVLHVWPISSGRAGYATPTGTFQPAWMAKTWYSRQYDNAPMPHAVFFNGGIAFHATTAVSMLGRPASHGCVRLAPDSAARLYSLVRTHGLLHTKVVVHGVPKFEQPSVVAGKMPRPPRGQPAAWQWSFFK